MPQKSRREKERAAARRQSGKYKMPVAPAPIEMPKPDAELGLTTSMPATLRGTTAPHHAVPINADSDFDYSYVYADLRRIALLAILCFGAMFVLAFVLNR
jgi:hypothetical protein